MGRRYKSSVAVAQQNRQILSFMVCKRQIETAIPVEIADSDIVRTSPGGKRRARRRRKTSFPISQQDGSIAALDVRSHDIELAVPIKIGDCNAAWCCSNREALGVRRG